MTVNSTSSFRSMRADQEASNLNTTNSNISTTATESQQWRQRLLAFAQRVADSDFALSRKLVRLLDEHNTAEVTIAFGGHFKSGKSTTVNAALGRVLLPTDRLPDTGAMCLLQSGHADTARVHSKRSIVDIACTPEAIRQEISLTAADGERRLGVHDVERLEITLAQCPIPPNVRWIDTPGINDTPKMNACARRAAQASDVLVWVLTSRQPLSLEEVDFLKDYIAEHGSCSVVFVLNSFLDNDEEGEWNSFLQRSLPRIRSKVYEFKPAMGLSQNVELTVIPVASRALERLGGDGFGGAALRTLLNGLRSPAHTRVIRTRMCRAALAIRVLANSVETEIKQERARLATVRARQEYEQAVAQEKLKKLKHALADAVDRCQSAMLATMQPIGMRCSSTISTVTLKRDDTHKNELNGQLYAACVAPLETLLADIAMTLQSYSQPPLSPSQQNLIGTLFLPGDVTVSIPQNTPVPTKGSGGTAVVGGIIGFFMGGPVGAVVGASLGVAAGGDDGKNEALQKDLAGLKSNILAAAEQAVADTRSKTSRVTDYLTNLYTMSPPTIAINTSGLTKKEALLRKLLEFANEAFEMGGWSGR